MSLHIVSIKSIRDITKDAVAVGILEAEKIRYPKRDLISQREAYRRFGETSIKRWRDAGLSLPNAQDQTQTTLSPIQLLKSQKRRWQRAYKGLCSHHQ